VAWKGRWRGGAGRAGEEVWQQMMREGEKGASETQWSGGVAR